MRERLGIAQLIGTYDVLCECADSACSSRVEVPGEVYDRVRDDDGSFVVAAGHGRPGHEQVVATGPDYVVAAAAA